MKLFVDMHVHSKFSVDGTSTMEEYCLAAEKTGSRIICFTEHCVFNDLRCTRDNEDVALTWARIRENRKNNVSYDQTGDVIRYAGDIVDYMEIANLLITYDSRTYGSQRHSSSKCSCTVRKQATENER